MVDSRATHHIILHCLNFATWTPTKGVVSLGGHAEIAQIGIGTAALCSYGSDKMVHPHNVMHIPDAGACYFWVSALIEWDGQITFKNKKLLISVQGQQVVEGYQEGNLFWINIYHTTLHIIGNTPTSLVLWHGRMRHMSYNTLKQHKDLVKGISLDPEMNHDGLPCPSCELGKQIQLSFPELSKHLDWRLQIIHSDLVGPMQPCSIQGSLYIATFIDDYSRHGVVYFLKSKNKCAATFKKFLATFGLQRGVPITHCSDNLR